MSLAMPWLTLSAVGLVNMNISVSPFEIVAELFSGSSTGGMTNGGTVDPSIQPLVDKIAMGVLVTMAGALILFVGSIVALASRYGGIIMVVGTGLALAGAAMASFSFGVLGTTVSFGPGWGFGVAFLASFVALGALAVKEPVVGEPINVWDPFTGQIRTIPRPPPYTPPPPTQPQPPQQWPPPPPPPSQ